MGMGDLSSRSVGAGKRSATFFETMAEATKEGKKALAGFLAKWAA
jgi:hypothetical protein